MAGDILDRLFHGEIIPWENRPEETEAFKQLNKRMAQVSDQLEERLDEESKALLDRLLADHADMELLYCCDNFKTGFRLGAQIILSVLKVP